MAPAAAAAVIEEKSRRPPGDSFRQQRMAAWQPIMTPLKIIIVFIAAGVCFIPTGTSVWKASNSVSHCHSICFNF